MGREKENLINKQEGHLIESKNRVSSLEVALKEKQKNIDELEFLAKNLTIETEKKMLEKDRELDLIRRKVRMDGEERVLNSFNSHDSYGQSRKLKRLENNEFSFSKSYSQESGKRI